MCPIIVGNLMPGELELCLMRCFFTRRRFIVVEVFVFATKFSFKCLCVACTIFRSLNNFERQAHIILRISTYSLVVEKGRGRSTSAGRLAAADRVIMFHYSTLALKLSTEKFTEIYFYNGRRIWTMYC